MKKNTNSLTSRRRFIAATGLVGTGMLAAPSLFSSPALLKYYNGPNSKNKGVRIGAITYSYRSMKDQSAEATLQYLVDSGINATELMGDPAEMYAGKPSGKVDRRAMWGLRRKSRSENGLTENEKKEMAEMQSAMEVYSKEVAEWRAGVSMTKFAEVKEMYKAAGVQIYGFKPSTFSKNNSDAEINFGFKAAKALGASHVTLEHPSDDEYTLKLGKMASKHGIYVGYHGHEQQTPDFWDTALEQSEFNALNLDVGHYVAAGNPDPLILLRKKNSRIMSMHVKDRRNPENGKDNMPFGEGDTPIVQVLQLMRDEKYKFPATIELEYEIPEGSDAVAEVKKCVEYCKTAIEG